MTRSVLSEHLRVFLLWQDRERTKMNKENNINAIFGLKQYHAIQIFNISDSKDLLTCGHV